MQNNNTFKIGDIGGVLSDTADVADALNTALDPKKGITVNAKVIFPIETLIGFAIAVVLMAWLSGAGIAFLQKKIQQG